MAYDDFTAKMVSRVHELENALAEKDQEIAYLQSERLSAAAMGDQRDREYHVLMGQAIKMAECAELLSDASLRVGEFDTESDGWPIYHHTGGLHNECSGVIADVPYKKLADAFVKYHEHAVAFLASPEVRTWREQEGR